MHYNPSSIALAQQTVDYEAEQNGVRAVLVESCPTRWNATLDAQPPGSEKDWKVQPEKKASPESRALARRLGTFTERYLRPVGGRVKWVGRWRVDTS